jgi:hypothetical protein
MRESGSSCWTSAKARRAASSLAERGQKLADLFDESQGRRGKDGNYDGERNVRAIVALEGGVGFGGVRRGSEREQHEGTGLRHEQSLELDQ